MIQIDSFQYQAKGRGRPQIILLGNGLERFSGQKSWDELIKIITVNDCIPLEQEEIKRTPFPLLYTLVCTSYPTYSPLNKTDIQNEERRLAKAMNQLQNKSNKLLDMIPSIGADHIFTSNYSYSLEKAFLPNSDFSISSIRTKYRFNLNPEKKNTLPSREINYRIHTGYLVQNKSGASVGLWHIHGESSVPHGIILGHDPYCRLIRRIESVCSNQNYELVNINCEIKKFRSWPELFLYGDIYIVGFGFWECEIDLWWLLRRKQRERYGDGRVFFFDKDQKLDIRKKLLLANGVILCDIGNHCTYEQFYTSALNDISNKIKTRRE